MEALYTQLPAWDEATRTALWERWLWESDCTAPPLERCFDMNEMHMLGVLVCVGEWHHPVSLYARGECIAPETTGGGDAITVIHLHPHTPVARLSVRETLDQIECLQLHWGPVLSECGHATALQLLRGLMARLGELASHAYPMELDGVVATEAEAAAAADRAKKKGGVAPPPMKKVLDDPQHATPLPAAMKATAARRMTDDDDEEEEDEDEEDDDDDDDDVGCLGLLSRKSLRQSICVLLALLRVHCIVSRAVEAPPASAAEERDVVGALRQHHIEASMDIFNDLQQMVHLAPGQRLAYRTAFHGMYNHVSQVVYFHHPRFCRGAQLDLARIPSSPLHMVPLVMQLLPEITLAYDDDAHVPGLTPPSHTNTDKEGAPADDAAGGRKKGWHWLVCCGAFFLVVRAPFFFLLGVSLEFKRMFDKRAGRGARAAAFPRASGRARGVLSAHHGRDHQRVRSPAAAAASAFGRCRRRGPTADDGARRGRRRGELHPVQSRAAVAMKNRWRP
jgi:hypothetical protein